MAKSDGIICGMEIAKLVFDTVSGNTSVWEPLLTDGDFVKNGTPIAKISGEARDIYIIWGKNCSKFYAKNEWRRYFNSYICFSN
jgi:nicotinate-nucleotide pyrophosphorylase